MMTFKEWGYEVIDIDELLLIASYILFGWGKSHSEVELFEVLYVLEYKINTRHGVHTPRVNGEIPNVNDATLDHERLSGRLVTYGLAELQMEGDGNCQVNGEITLLYKQLQTEYVECLFLCDCCETLFYEFFLHC
ncbi:OTU domain-containing protein [Cucumis melo var. makuwa]|uniref:OTU domain-containing protein n=1 Tax=Cucumis melo var. makuwa TaxID=1194695 RepID=A0A5D3DWQ4_CUCMM|nr:OTU domain-containing protein [Cucumis melo var. makuwa]TYK28071.1 OTU domain-containing protein [Cucumis melo var. makuwa]